jgi:hypothetical protein
MLRLTPVFVTVLAVAVLVLSVAAPPATAKQQKKVTIDVKCRPKGDPTKEWGPTKVTVDPWLLFVQPGDEIKWKIKIDDTDNNWIVVAPKDANRWPYKATEHKGNPDKDAHAKEWKEVEGLEFDYNITVHCNAYEFVIDPRVRVGP